MKLVRLIPVPFRELFLRRTALMDRGILSQILEMLLRWLLIFLWIFLWMWMLVLHGQGFPTNDQIGGGYRGDGARTTAFRVSVDVGLRRREVHRRIFGMIDADGVVAAAAGVIEYMGVARGMGDEERCREGGRDGLSLDAMVGVGSVVVAVIFETRAGWCIRCRGGAVGYGGAFVGGFCGRGGLNQGGLFVVHGWVAVQEWKEIERIAELATKMLLVRI
mmetsp:Transcript_2285/g.4367  ORF Transcript_2285/g.4367 Transcript_2285/m.4367 type:complete len:219 (-) Transcript_2285:11-667(-)